MCWAMFHSHTINNFSGRFARQAGLSGVCNPTECQDGNHRKGTFRKTVDAGSDRFAPDIPRDREVRKAIRSEG